jgi:hypothetical protein
MYTWQRQCLFQRDKPASQRCYIRAMTAWVQLQKMYGREPQGAWRQNELIGAKPLVANWLWLWRKTLGLNSRRGLKPRMTAGECQQQFNHLTFRVWVLGCCETVAPWQRRGRQRSSHCWKPLRSNDVEDIAHALVICKESELAIALYILVDWIVKRPWNPITTKKTRL